ncbi:unnamed protein product [Gadus morhua 'NCC']
MMVAELGGCGLFGVGVWLVLHPGRVLLPAPVLPSLSAANLLLCGGRRHHGHGLPGLPGRAEEQRCLLMTFFVILLLLVLTEVTLVLVIHVFHNTLDTKAQDELKEAMKTYTSDEA